MKRLLLILILTLLAACNEGAEGDKVKQVIQSIAEPKVADDKHDMPLEYKFAVVSVGKYIPENDPSVIHSKELLDRAANEYGEAPVAISDMSIAGANAGKEEGIDVTALEVLEAGAICHIGEGTPEFAKVIALYLGVRKGGQSHTEAVVGLKGILNIAAGK